MSKYIEKFLRHFKIIKFINKYRAIHNWNKKIYHEINQNMYLKRLQKYYLLTEKDIEFIKKRLIGDDY